MIFFALPQNMHPAFPLRHIVVCCFIYSAFAFGFQGNFIGIHGTKVLAMALRENTTLRSLRIESFRPIVDSKYKFCQFSPFHNCLCSFSFKNRKRNFNLFILSFIIHPPTDQCVMFESRFAHTKCNQTLCHSICPAIQFVLNLNCEPNDNSGVFIMLGANLVRCGKGTLSGGVPEDSDVAKAL